MLKQCPFCESEVLGVRVDGSGDYIEVFVECKICGATGPTNDGHRSEQEALEYCAVEDWNNG